MPVLATDRQLIFLISANRIPYQDPRKGFSKPAEHETGFTFTGTNISPILPSLFTIQGKDLTSVHLLGQNKSCKLYAFKTAATVYEIYYQICFLFK
jgi:hypothetical protein